MCDFIIADVPQLNAIVSYNNNNVYNSTYSAAGTFGRYTVQETGYYGFEVNNLTLTISGTLGAGQQPIYGFYISSSDGQAIQTVTASVITKSTSTINYTFSPRQYLTGTVIDFGLNVANSGGGVTFQSGSISAGAILQSTLSGGTLYALAPFSSSINSTQFCLDEQFAIFYGYLFLPQGYGTYPSSSLYPTYGSVDYNFYVSPGDIIKFNLFNISYEFEIASTTVTTGSAGTGSLCFNVNSTIPDALVGSFGSVNTVLILKKLKDETNIILSYAKPSGSTSYGFLIPENLAPEVLANIDTITSQVETRLVNDQGSIIGSVDGGGF